MQIPVDEDIMHNATRGVEEPCVVTGSRQPIGPIACKVRSNNSLEKLKGVGPSNGEQLPSWELCKARGRWLW